MDQLRLAVAFAHAVPTALLTIGLDRGRSLRCSHDRRLAPDLHPCQARQLVAGARSGGPADWIGGVAGLTLGGPRLADEGGGLYQSEVDDGVAWSFATTLAALDARALVEEALSGLYTERGLAPDRERLAELDLRANIDQSLGVVVMTCPDTPPGAVVTAAVAARRALSVCLVGELCGAVTAERGLR
jgi:hypothetical protein